MSRSEPEEPDRGLPPERREDIDAAFAEIVSGWRAESEPPRWPDGDDRDDASDLDDGATLEQPGEVDPADEEHYQPPEPPPLPVLRPRTLGGLAALGVGMLLLIAPGLVGLSEPTATILGVLALAGGVGWLILGLREGPPADSGWDDGARL